MYAVILSGGKQYKVEKNKLLKIEKINKEINDSIDFDRVLLIDDGVQLKIGTPYLENVKVSAEVVEHGRAKKIHIIKFKRRKHHMKQMGHRQYFTKVKIIDIKEE